MMVAGVPGRGLHVALERDRRGKIARHEVLEGTMTTRPVDASAADTYALSADVAGRPAFGPGSHSDSDGDADLTETTPRPGMGPALLFWSAFAVIATAFSAMFVVDLDSARVPGTRWWLVWLVAAHHGVMFTLWLYVTFQVTERFPIGRAHLGRRLAVHAFTAVALSAVSTVELYWYLDVAPLADPKMPQPGWGTLFRQFIAYPIFAALAHVLVYAKRYWRVRVAAHRLREELAEAGRRRTSAELRALKAEINPHFLGSALGAVSALLRTDPAAAERVLAELGTLLRVALARAQTQEVTLRDELETLEPFLDVERARLGWHFEVALSVTEEALDALVPDMILQPMVENAVRRGLACYPGGQIRISARRLGRHDELLEVRVTDEGTGAWGPPSVPLAPATASAWVANTRARLVELYGSNAWLELPSHLADATRSAASSLTIPWREADTDMESQDSSRVGATTEDVGEPVAPVPAPRRWRLRPVPTVSFLLLSVLLTFQHIRRVLPDGTTLPVPLRHAIPAGLVAAAIMVAIGCTAFYLTRRYPPVASGEPATPRGRLLIAHAKAALSLGFMGAVLRMGNSWVFGYLYDYVAQIRIVKVVSITLGTMAMYVFVYCILAVIAYGTQYARRYRQARATARRLRAELAEAGQRRATAELRALKAELNPHFLGNALHTVSALARTEPEAAERVLSQLNELLRTAVTRSRTHEVTLREELETLEPYLAVEQARLGRRLDVTWDVDEDLLDARVPHMILQPLVENAVKHGLAPRRAAGHIEVAARRATDRLELSVRDDGVGLHNIGPSRAVRGRGVGLANTRARLAELYGGVATLDLMAGETGGAVARLSLPWRDVAATSGGVASTGSSASEL